jgi:GNAT superfamily N-acetyltransferase
MNIKKQEKKSESVKFEMKEGEKIIGRAYLYLIYNDLHNEPYGLLEDVFVDEAYRKQGIGGQLVKAVIEEAKKLGCYKLVGTSRNSRIDVHEFYKKLGFEEYGKEFRKTLTK